MTKTRKVLAGTIALVFFGGWFVCWNLGHVVKAGIEYFGPQVLGVSVKVSSVLLSPLGGYCRIRGLEIGNPKGYESPTLMKVGSITAKVELGSLTGDRIVLREVALHDPEIHWEGDLSGSNVSRLEARANHSATKGGDTKATRDLDPTAFGRRSARGRAAAPLGGATPCRESAAAAPRECRLEQSRRRGRKSRERAFRPSRHGPRRTHPPASSPILSLRLIGQNQPFDPVRSSD